MIPTQAPLIALGLRQSIEKGIPQLRIRYRVCDQQKEIARQSDGLVCVRPRLHIDGRGGDGAGEKEYEGEGGG